MLGIGLDVDEFHRGAKDHPAILFDFLGVDHLGMGQFGLELGNAALDKSLALFGRIVLGILGQIPLRTGLGNRLDHGRSFHMF